jgi:histidyl-tRNA synthetase
MKPSIPKGTRDFSSTEVANRTYIMNAIKSSFENFGFAPIETPSFENSETLMGKYGDEGDRLIFKILNSGDFLSKADENLLEERDSLKLTSQISEKALRYDLTVPFARYVVQHQNEITFPFKRYQIQPVWRADRPQKGRFREFFQCDADVVGSKSLWQEVEFVQLYDDVFSKLKLNGSTIKINNRKILSGIAEVIGASDKLIDFTVALDKLDKIGKDGVVKEMLAKGITEEAIEKVNPLFEFSGDNQQKLDSLENLLSTSQEGKKGVAELRFVIDTILTLGLKTTNLEVDVTLARGLNYYTGAIFEVAAPEEVNMGSIGGGGRYDDLTGIFGMPDVSGVGISFGLDRIYLVLEELNLFESVELPKPKVLFVNFGEKEALFCVKAMVELRKQDIKCELFPDDTKMKKQMNYANKREIPFVVIVGSQEIEKNKFNLKNMITGEQNECSLAELVKKLK